MCTSRDRSLWSFSPPTTLTFLVSSLPALGFGATAPVLLVTLWLWYAVPDRRCFLQVQFTEISEGLVELDPWFLLPLPALLSMAWHGASRFHDN